MNSNQTYLKSELKEALLRVDEIQKKVTEELRINRDNIVEWNEYQSLKIQFNSCLDKLAESNLRVDSFSKRLATKQNEIQFLDHKNELLLNENRNLKNKLSSFENTIEDQKQTILQMNSLRENTLLENLGLKQVLKIIKNELSEDINISVDYINQSMVKFWESLDCNANQELCDSDSDNKLMDIEKALEAKKQLNEDLKHKTNLLNEEIRKLNHLKLEFENRVSLIKSDSNQSYLKQKKTFDKVFDLIEDKLLSQIPLNQYFVPLSRKVIFSLTPGFVIKVFGIFDSFY